MGSSERPVLLVTGGSRGIGAAIAKLAAERGFDVAVNYLSNARAAHEVVAAIESAGRRAVAIQGDMARESDIERVVTTAARELGGLTHLVYNSGVTGPPSRLEHAEIGKLREVFDVNVLGALIAVRASIPLMSARHGGAGGAIVLISSAAATLGSAGEYVWYAASKAAIDTMTIGLGRELAPDRIRVNAVAPGLIETEIHAPGRLDRLVPLVPLERAGAPSEVAEAVLYLLSDRSTYVTGTVLRVAGGR
jgi:NAD(P)-dependent dehydrogenase (short-subunit alcohol dehydrogenase family)